MNNDQDHTPHSARQMFRGTVRTRTLAFIRWIAVAGQLATILTVYFGFGFDLPIVYALAVVGASVVFNLWSWFGPWARARLSNGEATLSLGFDILQLSLLLYLAGGLLNPFSLLILAPVTIAATILSLRSTVALGVLSALCITALWMWHLPLPWEGYPNVALPLLYLLGLWVAIVLAIGLLAAYNWSIAEESRRMSEALAATQSALAREQRVSALGMLAAFTAHRLGSPLGTIAVVAKEIAHDLPEGSPLADDVALLLSESQRCREILAGLDGHRDEAGGSPFARLPVTALVKAAAEPRGGDRVAIRFESGPAVDYPGTPVPQVAHSPEILHGLGSIIENAVQFARHEVAITTTWSPEWIEVAVGDDGPGFPAHILSLIGEPYISSRKGIAGHMGLGLFIANTLLERTGGAVTFANSPLGALVTVRWPRVALERREEPHKLTAEAEL